MNINTKKLVLNYLDQFTIKQGYDLKITHRSLTLLIVFDKRAVTKGGYKPEPILAKIGKAIVDKDDSIIVPINRFKINKETTYVYLLIDFKPINRYYDIIILINNSFTDFS